MKINPLPMKKAYPDYEKFDIYSWGNFRIGLTPEETKEYLQYRNSFRKKKIRDVEKKFNKLFGIQTCGSCVINGNKWISLYYRDDVKRFADVLFGVTKGTYFD